MKTCAGLCACAVTVRGFHNPWICAGLCGSFMPITAQHLSWCKNKQPVSDFSCALIGSCFCKVKVVQKIYERSRFYTIKHKIDTLYTTKLLRRRLAHAKNGVDWDPNEIQDKQLSARRFAARQPGRGLNSFPAGGPSEIQWTKSISTTDSLDSSPS